MQYIDAHQHFWHYHPLKHDWINDEMAVIRKDFLPEDLLPVLKANGMDGCVAVQADQTEKETDFLIRLAAENSFIKGIVGWVDLKADNIKERLSHYAAHSTIKGFRHVLQGEDPAFMLDPLFTRGIAALRGFDLTYDILIFPKHLDASLKLVQQFPDQPFVIDHIAKPYIRAGQIDEWEKGIKAIAVYPNVHCKISGMVTEADFQLWKITDFKPYLDVVVNAFGINRIMFGSDWPVCLVAASYEKVLGIVKDYFSSFSKEEKAMLFAGNAIKFYDLI